MGPVEKSLARKLRRLWSLLPGYTTEENYTRSIFEIGKFAAQLAPFWMESDYGTFQEYLYHRCGMNFGHAGKIDLFMHTYYEVPSLAIWLEVGWRNAARAAIHNVEGQQEYLLKRGLNVLDLMTLVR